MMKTESWSTQTQDSMDRMSCLDRTISPLSMRLPENDV